MAEVIGIGDLHFSKLDSIVPDASAKICRSVRKVFKYALERGVQNVIFYGDICDKPRMDEEAQCQLLDTILRDEYRELNIHFILGNHDFAENGSYSLRFLEIIAKRLNFNVKVYTKPAVVDMDGVPFNMMPYPYEETTADAVNVIHFEVAGSTRDNGRVIDSGCSNKHVCLAGHLHTAHRIRNTYYSGTIHQTNFGESMPKFFHHARFDSVRDYEVDQVPFKPPWELNNLVVKTAKDLKGIREEDHILYKLFVHDGADIDINQVLTKYPNIVRHNSFKSKSDLQQQIEEAWDFDFTGEDGSAAVNDDDLNDLLVEHLSKKLNPKQVKRGEEIMRGLKGNK